MDTEALDFHAIVETLRREFPLVDGDELEDWAMDHVDPSQGTRSGPRGASKLQYPREVVDGLIALYRQQSVAEAS